MDVSDRKGSNSEYPDGRAFKSCTDFPLIMQLECCVGLILAIFDNLPAEFKNIDILVNNAGLVYGREHVGDV